MTKKFTTVRRVRITMPSSECRAAFAWCVKNGYQIVRSGPPRAKGKSLLADAGRFVIIAEKVTV